MTWLLLSGQICGGKERFEPGGGRRESVAVDVIRGQGLAGTCLMWRLHHYGASDWVVTDREQRKGSSDVAAGMMNPIAGKGWNAGWRVAEFLPEAVQFYEEIGELLGQTFFQPMFIERFTCGAKEAEKVRKKWDALSPWLDTEKSDPDRSLWIRGGRLRTSAFLNASRDYFTEKGLFVPDVRDGRRVVECCGAEGLLAGTLPHRCAKGEIITVRADSDLAHMIVKNGTWAIPDGDGIFRVGATYEWEQMDCEPTAEALRVLTEKATELLGPLEVVAHQAGIRPILRQSQPVASGSFFNGLGSKGAMYAPSAAVALAEHLLNGTSLPDDLSLESWLTSARV